MVGKIVNGDLAEFGRYPYMTALRFNGEQFCGGTLIAPSVVLTAAHCLEDETNVDRLSVALGCVDITPDNIGNCEVFRALSFELHPEYDLNLSLDGGNDVALIVLDGSSTQEPIHVAAPGFNFTTEPVFMTGWGNENPIYEGEFIGSTLLREANGNLISNEECIERLQDFVDINNTDDYVVQLPNSESIICSFGDSEAVCQGDSGGPLMIRCNGADQDLQLGITSFGIGCGFQGLPDIFARTFTQSAFDFITDVATTVGQIVSFRTNFDNFCLDDPVVLPTNPTPFP